MCEETRKAFPEAETTNPYIQIIPGNPTIKNNHFIINDTNALVL